MAYRWCNCIHTWFLVKGRVGVPICGQIPHILTFFLWSAIFIIFNVCQTGIPQPPSRQLRGRTIAFYIFSKRILSNHFYSSQQKRRNHSSSSWNAITLRRLNYSIVPKLTESLKRIIGSREGSSAHVKEADSGKQPPVLQLAQCIHGRQFATCMKEHQCATG